MSNVENENQGLTSPDQEAPTTSEKLTKRVMETVKQGVTVADELHDSSGRLKGFPTGPGTTTDDLVAPPPEETLAEKNARLQKEIEEAMPDLADRSSRTAEALKIGEAVLAQNEEIDAQEARDAAIEAFRAALEPTDENGEYNNELFVPYYDEELEEVVYVPDTAKLHVTVQGLLDALQTDPNAAESVLGLIEDYEFANGGDTTLRDAFLAVSQANLEKPLVEATQEMEELDKYSVEHLDALLKANEESGLHLPADEVRFVRDSLFNDAMQNGLDPTQLDKAAIAKFNDISAVIVAERIEAEERAAAATRRTQATADDMGLTKDSKDSSGKLVTRTIQHPEYGQVAVPFRQETTLEQVIDFDKAIADYEAGIRRGRKVVKKQELKNSRGEVIGAVDVEVTEGRVTARDLAARQRAAQVKADIEAAKPQNDPRRREFERIQRAAEEARRAQERRRIEEMS